MGPIPFAWLAEAARQPGRALHVAIALWFLSGMTKNRKVTLSGSVLRILGVKRHSGYRGLKCLEKANLLRVKRHSGRNPIVTLLDFRKSDDTGQ